MTLHAVEKAVQNKRTPLASAARFGLQTLTADAETAVAPQNPAGRPKWLTDQPAQQGSAFSREVQLSAILRSAFERPTREAPAGPPKILTPQKPVKSKDNVTEAV